MRTFGTYQFVIFKPLSYCFEKTKRIDAKVSFGLKSSSAASNQLIQKPGDITKKMIKGYSVPGGLFMN